MNLNEEIYRIQSMMGLLSESSNDVEVIKSKLFEILKSSEYVEKHDYLWSINLLVGAPQVFVNLDESDFFDKTKSVYDIISEVWPYPDNYEHWKNLYHTLVLGYRIKDKNSDVSMTIEIYRYEKNKAREFGHDEFEGHIISNYVGQTKTSKKTSGEKMFVDDEIFNVFGLDADDVEYEPTFNNFIRAVEELKQVAKTLEDYKTIFKYLDAIV